MKHGWCSENGQEFLCTIFLMHDTTVSFSFFPLIFINSSDISRSHNITLQRSFRGSPKNHQRETSASTNSYDGRFSTFLYSMSFFALKKRLK